MATARYEAEVKVTSAKNLKNINWRHGPIKPYAVLWVDPNRKVSTHVDEHGDEEPQWNETAVLPFDTPVEDAVLHVDVVHAYAEPDTKPLIGSAKVRLREVVDDVGIGSRAFHKVQLKRPSGRPHGKVELDVVIKDVGRYHAPGYGVREAYAPPYGAPPPAAPYGAPPPSGYPYGAAPPPPGPPPPSGYPYGAAPPPPGPSPPSGYSYGQPSYGQPAANYGYGQPEYGYGQPQPAVVGEKKKSKFGMGTGLAVGAVAGALGGLALAEGFDKLEDHIADEAADKVEDDLAARDDFDDYGGDDFGGDDDGW